MKGARVRATKELDLLLKTLTAFRTLVRRPPAHLHVHQSMGGGHAAPQQFHLTGSHLMKQDDDDSGFLESAELSRVMSEQRRKLVAGMSFGAPCLRWPTRFGSLHFGLEAFDSDQPCCQSCCTCAGEYWAAACDDAKLLTVPPSAPPPDDDDGAFAGAKEITVPASEPVVAQKYAFLKGQAVHFKHDDGTWINGCVTKKTHFHDSVRIECESTGKKVLRDAAEVMDGAAPAPPPSFTTAMANPDRADQPAAGGSAPPPPQLLVGVAAKRAGSGLPQLTPKEWMEMGDKMAGVSGGHLRMPLAVAFS